MEKQIDKAMEDGLKALGVGLVKAVKGICKGIRKLGDKKYLVIFLICGAVSVVSCLCRQLIFALAAPIYIRYIIYLILLAVPFVYLYILGCKEVEDDKDKYTKLFAEIGFKGKDGKYPYFLGVKELDRKLIYTFKSNISIDEWRQNKSKLETALNVNILVLEQKDNKKIVQLTTVPADFKIPTMIRWSDENISEEDGVFRLGESALTVIQVDLNKTPHCLFAGETGSGKSVLLRTCLWQAVKKACKVFMIDFKGGVEFGIEYEKFGEVITDRKRALEVLGQLCEENEKRLSLFRSMRVKNLAEFNQKTGKNLCRICLFCDEIAEMLDKTGVSKEDKPIYQELEARFATLARLSRATGINLLLGMQRPDAKILPGQIKNNIPVRVSGRFADKTASEIVLGTTDATNLPNVKGRFLYKVGNEVIQFQSYFFDDDTMLHEVDVEQGGTLTDLKVAEHKTVDIEKIHIYGETEKKQPVKKEINPPKTPEQSTEKVDLDFNYQELFDSAPEPDYADEDEED